MRLEPTNSHVRPELNFRLYPFVQDGERARIGVDRRPLCSRSWMTTRKTKTRLRENHCDLEQDGACIFRLLKRAVGTKNCRTIGSSRARVRPSCAEIEYMYSG